MTNTLTISREQLERWLVELKSSTAYATRKELQSILAAPAVEASTCAQCKASTTDICNQNGCGYLESGNGAPAVERQEPVAYATFDAMRKLAEDSCNELIRRAIEHKDHLDKLHTSPPAPVAAPDDTAQNAKRYEWIRSPNVGHCEISRVLFETISDDCNPPYRALKCGKDLDAAIDACLDKVKEMNR